MKLGPFDSYWYFFKED